MTLRNQSKLPPTNCDALLIWSRNRNSGDLLIANACEQYLRDRGINAWRSDGSIEEAAIEGDTEYLGDLLATFRGMLMFSGGGNIGIYPRMGKIRSTVIANSQSRNRCLVFSQSALKPEPALVSSAVTVWCRDSVSQDVLQQAGTQTELVPDMALYLDKLILKSPAGEGMFYIKRTPGGDAETFDHGVSPPCDSTDLTLQQPLEQIIESLLPYEYVISDRLHGGLIALMMRKKVIFLPVAYHKIQSFYETWLQGNPNAGFAETLEDLINKVSSLRSSDADLSLLLCKYADPAFDRFLVKS